MSDNIEKLRAAGMFQDPESERYIEVFESLTEFEIEVIVSLKKRLDTAAQGLIPEAMSMYGSVGF